MAGGGKAVARTVGGSGKAKAKAPPEEEEEEEEEDYFSEEEEDFFDEDDDEEEVASDDEWTPEEEKARAKKAAEGKARGRSRADSLNQSVGSLASSGHPSPDADASFGAQSEASFKSSGRLSIESVGSDFAADLAAESKPAPKPRKKRTSGAGKKAPAADREPLPPAAPLPPDVASLKVPDLKELCRARGVAVSGKKQDLIDRLEAHEAALVASQWRSRVAGRDQSAERSGAAAGATGDGPGAAEATAALEAGSDDDASPGKKAQPAAVSALAPAPAAPTAAPKPPAASSAKPSSAGPPPLPPPPASKLGGPSSAVPLAKKESPPLSLRKPFQPMSSNVAPSVAASAGAGAEKPKKYGIHAALAAAPKVAKPVVSTSGAALAVGVVVMDPMRAKLLEKKASGTFKPLGGVPSAAGSASNGGRWK